MPAPDETKKTTWVIEEAPGRFTTVKAETVDFRSPGVVLFMNPSEEVLVLAKASGTWLSIHEQETGE